MAKSYAPPPRAEFLKKLRKAGIPSCTTERTFNGWLEAARIARPPAALGFCADCTSEYQAEMTAVGRCDWPDKLIIEVEEDDEAL